MHTEILDNKRIEMLKKIGSEIQLDYYMAGGTALSLQKGYRQSVDFDFFTREDFNSDALFDDLKNLGYNYSPINISNGTCDVNMDGVQVSFFRYPYKMLKEPVLSEEFPGIKFASIEDITAMKLIAVGQRGAKKDFYDLYEIIKDEKYNPGKLCSIIREKYGTSHDLSYIGMGMSYFEDADSQILGKLYCNESWDDIKKFFIKFSDNFIKCLEDYILRNSDNIDEIGENINIEYMADNTIAKDEHE